MSKIVTDYKTADNRVISYEIFDDGYDIYVGGNKLFVQREPAIPRKELSYVENAIKQIEEILVPKTIEPSVEEQLRADIDYLAVMSGIELV